MILEADYKLTVGKRDFLIFKLESFKDIFWKMMGFENFFFFG
jgi:hypothetical protein